MSKTNPLLSPWTGPFEAPPFNQIKPEHFGPAFADAMAAHLVEVEQIAANADAANFANTIVALENSGRALSRVSGVFWNLTGADSNDALQAVERDIAPKLADHGNKITSNAQLFGRIDAIFKHRAGLKLSAEDLRLLERQHLDFVRSGAALDAAAKERIGTIKQRLAALTTNFSQNVLADEKSFEMGLPDKAALAGLPDFTIAAAAEAAREHGSKASHVVTMNRSLMEPFLTFSTRRDLRERAFKAWQSRGAKPGPTDNRALINEILALRQQRAKLLGYASYADFKLDDTMAKTPAKVDALLGEVWQAGLKAAHRERDKLAAVAVREGVNLKIEPWDWRHYAEKVRKAEYDLNEEDIKPYLSLERMIAASFHVATKLFGLSFAERHDVPVYHPDVRVFEVTGRDGRHIGLFLADYFARPSKRSGAWMSEFRNGEKLKGNIRPIIVNVLNFAKAAEGEPTLLSFDDARTLFHEFGHGLHGLLSDTTYPSLAGTSVAHDFVELPSQLYEHWLQTKDVLGTFARHYKTGEPMPDKLIEKLRAARTFNQGFATVEYLASALVDMDAHAASGSGVDAMQRQTETLERLGMPSEIVMRHATPHFQHIYSGEGYAAGYYSYLWSEMLDSDAFRAFEETGDVYNPELAKKLHDHIYSAGNRQDAEQAYLAFRGRMPKVDGILRQRGLV
jgi:peptidyl-dipeptidase Dcp